MGPRRRPASLPRAIVLALALVAWGESRAAAQTLERDILALVNRHRADRGLPALATDSRIGREAQRHSAAMASGATPFGHDGFNDRVAALRRFMTCRTGAENIAAELGHEDPAREVVRGWLASRGHRKNIEGPYDTTGIGIARSPTGKLYFTQIFIGR